VDESEESGWWKLSEFSIRLSIGEKRESARPVAGPRMQAGRGGEERKEERKQTGNRKRKREKRR